MHAHTRTTPCTRTNVVLNRRKNGPQDEVTDAHLSKPVFTLVWEIVKMMVECLLVSPIAWLITFASPIAWLIAFGCSDFLLGCVMKWHAFVSTRFCVISSRFKILGTYMRTTTTICSRSNRLEVHLSQTSVWSLPFCPSSSPSRKRASMSASVCVSECERTYACLHSSGTRLHPGCKIFWWRLTVAFSSAFFAAKL